MLSLPHDNEGGNDIFEEHQYLSTCLDMGLRIEDLKQLTYIDVLKLMLCKIRKNKKPSVRKATQSDWDALAGG